ncbi:hypothetical protein BZM27_53535 [Paraburkholderia steynii]|uniref:Uncharacterized protein n=1 Tax=Paraburkholderia steynii TaxID=1245441 RepID=A0A4R0XA58_9BURK|nr:hypothetical protein BZM27_53535 [Paraburkholderia steynii]
MSGYFFRLGKSVAESAFAAFCDEDLAINDNMAPVRRTAIVLPNAAAANAVPLTGRTDDPVSETGHNREQLILVSRIETPH